MKMTVEIITTKTIDPEDIADCYYEEEMPTISDYVAKYLEEDHIDVDTLKDEVWDEIIRQVGESLRNKIYFDCM